MISKWSSSGTRIWTRLLGGLSSDVGTGIATDLEGNAYVNGESNSAVIDGQTNSGSNDIVISKWHSNGTRLWTQLLGGTGDDQGYGITTDSEGNVAHYRKVFQLPFWTVKLVLAKQIL